MDGSRACIIIASGTYNVELNGGHFERGDTVDSECLSKMVKGMT